MRQLNIIIMTLPSSCRNVTTSGAVRSLFLRHFAWHTCVPKELKTKVLNQVLDIMEGNILKNCCCVFLVVNLFINIPGRYGLSIFCKPLGMERSSIGVLGVRCDLSRILEEYETAVWMLTNCTRIGNCTQRGCLFPVSSQYQINIISKLSLLYDHKRNIENLYLLSVCDQSENVISQSNVVAPTNTTTGENDPLIFTTRCSCVGQQEPEMPNIKHRGHDPTNDIQENERTLDVDWIDKYKSYFGKTLPMSTSSPPTLSSDISGDENFVTSTLPSRTSILYITDNKDLDTPILSATLVIGIIVMVSAFAVVSSICTCYVSFRKSKQESFRPQAINVFDTTSNNGDAANVSTSVLLHPALAPSSFSCSIHSIANHCQMENEHVYEAPDVHLVGERPPLPSRNCTPILEKNGWVQQRDMGEQTFENPFYESYDKLMGRQLISMEKLAESAPDLYQEVEPKETSNMFRRTISFHSVDNLKQKLHSSLPCEILNLKDYETLRFSTMSEPMENFSTANHK